MATNDLDRLNGVDLDTEYTDVNAVVQAMAELEHAFTANPPISRLGVFVTAYRYITIELQQRLADDRAGITRHFLDPKWVQDYLLNFANLYRKALAAYRGQHLADVPPAWRTAFNEAISGNTVVLQDLLLGINAHINNDLPQALAAVGVEPEAQRLADHEAVNAALSQATNTVQDHLSDLYGSFLGLLDWVGGPLDEEITNFSFAKVREEAWLAGVDLSKGVKTRQQIETAAGDDADLIVGANKAAPEIASVLRWFESVWERTFPSASPPPATEDTAPALMQPMVSASDQTGPSTTPPAAAKPSPLRDQIDRLTATVAELDAQRSRLALYAALFRDILRRVDCALVAGQFADPQWVTAVQEQCVRLYLNAQQAFRTQQLEYVPASWLIAFEGALRLEAIAPQVLALGATAYLAHDVPIALLRGLFWRDRTQHKADYDRVAAITETSVEIAIATTMNKYPARATAAASPQDSSRPLFRYDCADAAAAGFKNALAFAAVRKGDVHRQFRILDRETSQRTQCLLVPALATQPAVIRALLRYEKSWTGAWSDWILPRPTLYRSLLGAGMDDIAPGLQDFLERSDGRRAAGTVRLVRGRGWWPPLVADALGFPTTGKAIPLHLEVVAQDDQEHWFQILGTQAWTTQHWARNGNLIVAYGPLRFTFTLVADAGALRFEHIGTALLALPLPRSLAPAIQVRVKASGKCIDVGVSVRNALVGELVQYAGQLVVQ